MSLWLKEKHLWSTKKKLRNNKNYRLQAKFENSIKWEFRTNKGRNSCGLSEDIIVEFASRWKEKWVHFPSLKVTRVDGTKIIVLCVCVCVCVCVCDTMPSIQLLNHLIRFHSTQWVLWHWRPPIIHFDIVLSIEQHSRHTNLQWMNNTSTIT